MLESKVLGRRGILSVALNKIAVFVMFILVTDGMPCAVKEMPPNEQSASRLAVVSRFWEQQHLFDSKSRYRCIPVDVPLLTPIQRFLAWTFYNPVIPFHGEWVRVGDFDRNDLTAAVKSGLEHDDDIIQQWFEADDVLKLLNAADGWDEVLLAVEAIEGGHEVNEEVAAYVKRILPNVR